MIIPNHMFMSDLLFNWTQNDSVVRDNAAVGVSDGSDTELVKKIMIEATKSRSHILQTPNLQSFLKILVIRHWILRFIST